MDGTSMQVYWCSQRVKMFASWDWPSIVWWDWALAYPLPMEERFRPAGRPVRWPAPAKAASPAVAAAVAAVALRCRNDWRRESSSNGSESCCWRSIGIRTRNSRKWLWVWWACCVRTTDARRTQDAGSRKRLKQSSVGLTVFIRKAEDQSRRGTTWSDVGEGRRGRRGAPRKRKRRIGQIKSRPGSVYLNRTVDVGDVAGKQLRLSSHFD